MALTLDQFRWITRQFEAEATANEAYASGAKSQSVRVLMRTLSEQWEVEDGR